MGHELSRKIVPHKSLISLRIQTFFFILPTVNSENPFGMGLFHPFFRAIPTLGNTPARCITWAIHQLSSMCHALSLVSPNPKDSMSFGDILGWIKLNSFDILNINLIDYVLRLTHWSGFVKQKMRLFTSFFSEFHCDPVLGSCVGDFLTK